MPEERIIAVCPGCGNGPTQLLFSKVRAVVESGCESAICAGCQERITAKRAVEVQRDPSLSPKEKAQIVATLREKVSDAPAVPEQAPAPAAPAPVPQGKATPTG